MTNPSTDTPTREEFDSVAATLAELRTLLEQSAQHTSDAAARYSELRSAMDGVEQVQRELGRDMRMLRQRIDERFGPPGVNCPHCGAKVQREWVTCRMCTKHLQ